MSCAVENEDHICIRPLNYSLEKQITLTEFRVIEWDILSDFLTHSQSFGLIFHVASFIRHRFLFLNKRLQLANKEFDYHVLHCLNRFNKSRLANPENQKFAEWVIILELQQQATIHGHAVHVIRAKRLIILLRVINPMIVNLYHEKS